MVYSLLVPLTALLLLLLLSVPSQCYTMLPRGVHPKSQPASTCSRTLVTHLGRGSGSSSSSKSGSGSRNGSGSGFRLADTEGEGEMAGGYPSSNIVNIELTNELTDCFMSYAMSTILGRALPGEEEELVFPVFSRLSNHISIHHITSHHITSHHIISYLLSLRLDRKSVV